MARLNERTLQMMENFMELHNAGWTIKQIADKYELSVSTVYARLQEIADENGVTREELLKVVHSEPVCYVRAFEPVQPVDVKALNEQFDAIFKGLDTLIDIIDREIDKQEKYALDLKGQVEEWN